MMKPIARKRHTSPWGWVPTLYFAEGLPYVAVMTLSVILYKRLGLSNTEIAHADIISEGLKSASEIQADAKFVQRISTAGQL